MLNLVPDLVQMSNLLLIWLNMWLTVFNTYQMAQFATLMFSSSTMGKIGCFGELILISYCM